jgi:hypothetical protein
VKSSWRANASRYFYSKFSNLLLCVETLLNALFNKKSKKYYVLINGVLSAVILIGLFYLKTNPLDILKYIFFQAFYLMVPGLFLYHRLFKLKGEFIERLVLSYALGIVLTIIEYFVFYTMHFREGLIFIGPCLSIMEIILLSRSSKLNKKNIADAIATVPIQMVSIYFLLLFATFMGFTMTNPLPTLANSCYFDLDILFDIGNTQGLLRNFPLINARISGVQFSYQYFNSIHLAVQSYVTKIHPVIITSRFFPFFDMLLLAAAAFFVGRKFFFDDRKAIYFAFILFFTNSAASIMEFSTSGKVFCNFLFRRLFLHPRAVEIAISFVLILFGVLYDLLKHEKISWNKILLSGLFFFFLVGAKGPVAFVFFAAINLMLLFKILTRRMNSCYFVYWALLSIIFVGVYLILYQSEKGNVPSSDFLSFQIGSLLRQTIAYGRFATLFLNESLKSVIYILLIPFFLITYLPFAMPLFIVNSLATLRNVAKVASIKIFVIFASCCGIFLGIFVREVGRSNSYFIETAIPFITIAALVYLLEKGNMLRKRFQVMILAVFLLSLSTTAIDYLKTVQGAIKPIREPETFYGSERRAMILTNLEYQGLLWLNGNTENDVVISSDRYYRTKKQQGELGASWFYYSAFSNRQMYLEGWAYQHNLPKEILEKKLKVCALLYTERTASRGEIMKRNHIDYMIVSDFVNPGLKFHDETIQLVFENADIKIYKCDVDSIRI